MLQNELESKKRMRDAAQRALDKAIEDKMSSTQIEKLRKVLELYQGYVEVIEKAIEEER